MEKMQMKNVTMTFTDLHDTDHMVYMSDVETWGEIAEKFYFLLVSSGYVLSMSDLARKYTELANDYGSTLNNNYMSIDNSSFDSITDDVSIHYNNESPLSINIDDTIYLNNDNMSTTTIK
jgi:hypothetical protein